MPSVKVKTNAGSLHINYTISTPTNPSAKSIEKNIPTIIFLHPVYMGQEIYHQQFADPQLRKFNLIVMETRGHGDTSGKVGKTFSRVEAADDVKKFMDALRLPACHIIGLSMGACIGLQTAITYPEKVLSVTMISPLPLEEPEDVAAGRLEIYECWCEGIQGDKSALKDALWGACQLGFNSSNTSMVTALTTRIYPQALKNWSLKNLDDFRAISVNFFVDRKAHPIETLAKVKCPVHLIHCGGDIAYPFEFVTELQQAMQKAGVNVHVSTVPDAPHFGPVTHPKEINRMCHDWVSDLTNTPVPPVATAVSPFHATLKKCGLDADNEADFSS
ncbi:Alpha/Beta hydrolase protein [Schizophyllum commune]